MSWFSVKPQTAWLLSRKTNHHRRINFSFINHFALSWLRALLYRSVRTRSVMSTMAFASASLISSGWLNARVTVFRAVLTSSGLRLVRHFLSCLLPGWGKVKPEGGLSVHSRTGLTRYLSQVLNKVWQTPDWVDEISSKPSGYYPDHQSVLLFTTIIIYSETWITRTAGDHQKKFIMKSLSYESCSPFALAMWPP